MFSTAADGQDSVEINVLQGEREFASDLKSLGRFTLVGFKPEPRGMPQIEVGFNIDVNGVLGVSAVERKSGESADIVVEGSSTLDSAAVERAVKEASDNAVLDEERRERMAKCVQADNAVKMGEDLLASLEGRAGSGGGPGGDPGILKKREELREVIPLVKGEIMEIRDGGKKDVGELEELLKRLRGALGGADIVGLSGEVIVNSPVLGDSLLPLCPPKNAMPMLIPSGGGGVEIGRQSRKWRNEGTIERNSDGGRSLVVDTLRRRESGKIRDPLNGDDDRGMTMAEPEMEMTVGRERTATGAAVVDDGGPTKKGSRKGGRSKGGCFRGSFFCPVRGDRRR